MKKRLFVLVLAACLVLSLVPLPAFAEENAAVMAVQALIDDLPDTVTDENRQTVEDQLDAIDEAKLTLTDEERDTLDFAKYGNAIAVINTLDDQPDAEVPEALDADDVSGTSKKENWGVVDLYINMGRNPKLIYDQSLLLGSHFPFDIGFFECVLNSDDMPKDLTVTFDGLVMNVSVALLPDVGESRKFSYTLESEKYEDITVTVTLAFISKEEQKNTVDVFMETWTADGYERYPSYVPPVGWYYNMCVAYFQGEKEITGSITEPGNYTVIVSCEDDDCIYSGSADFSILSAGYTITLDPNGGTVTPTTVSTNANGTPTSLPIPNWEGHTFDGWYTQATDGEPVTESTTFTKDTTIYAHWKAPDGPNTVQENQPIPGESVTVYFYVKELPDPDEPLGVAVANADGKVEFLSDPSADGYEFLGWYTEPDGGGEKANENTTFLKNTNLYAYMKRTRTTGFTITFDPNGGTLPEGTKNPATTNEEGKLYSLPTPIREGYDFLLWYVDNKVTDNITSETVFTKDTTLHARWYKIIDTANISLSGYGNGLPISGLKLTWDESNGSMNSYYISSDIDGKRKVETTDTFTREGTYYLHVTITLEEDILTINKFTLNGESTNSWITQDGENMTVTFALPTAGYVITFDPNGGTVSPSTVTTGKDGKLSVWPEPTRAGYVFNGWWTKQDGGDGVKSGNSFTENATFYAHWLEVVDKVGFSLSGHGYEKRITEVNPALSTAGVAIEEDEYGVGYGISLSDETMTAVSSGTFEAGESYFFYVKFRVAKGYVAEGLTKENVTLGDLTALSLTEKEAVYTAVFQLPTIYLVTFDSNGGKLKDTEKTASTTNGKLTALPTPTREGYSFDGWSTEKDGGEKVTVDKTYSENTTLYARWKANTYTIHFDPNGGEGAMADQTVPQNKREGLKTNTFTRTGYTFTGWNAQADGKGTDYTDGQEVSDLTANGAAVTLYAQWKPNTYTLTFQTKGGSEVKPITQAYGTAIVAPTAPTRKGYTFAGWEPEMPETMPAKNMTLTAKWTVNSYTIHFDANGGTGTMKDLTVSYGQIQTLSANVYTLGGHKFHGWNTRSDGTGTAYEDTQMVQNLTEEDKKSIVLYAQWDKILERVDLTLSGHIFDKSVEQVKVTSQDAIVFRDPTYDGSWGITKDQKKLTTLSGKLFQADKQYYLWVKFSAKEGYALDGLTTKDVHLDGTEALSLTEKEGTITAVFRLPVIYTIQITVGKNGSVDADNVLRVFEGENVTINITPDSGYVVYRLEIDGTNVTTTRTYTFQNVQQSHTFKVRFLKNGSNAKTGDSFPLFPATATLTLSAIALTAAFLVAKKKRRTKIAR